MGMNELYFSPLPRPCFWDGIRFTNHFIIWTQNAFLTRLFYFKDSNLFCKKLYDLEEFSDSTVSSVCWLLSNFLRCVVCIQGMKLPEWKFYQYGRTLLDKGSWEWMLSYAWEKLRQLRKWWPTLCEIEFLWDQHWRRSQKAQGSGYTM